MTSSNAYCAALGIRAPRVEDARSSPDVNYYSLLLVALLERGEPMTLEEVAARLGVPPAPRCRSERALTAGDGQKLLGALTSATIRGALEYRACDEKARFNPTRVPFSFAESLKGLDRRLPG